MVITHPFHARRGRSFVLIDERRSKHGDRVWFEDDDGRVRTVPREWTDLADPVPFDVIAAGRTCFRADDLARVAALLEQLRRRE